MLMTHLLSTVFKGVVMLSQGSIHFRQELINLISYVEKGEITVLCQSAANTNYYFRLTT
jgi:hypothetical protein